MSIALSSEAALPEMELVARPHSGADMLMIVVMDGSSGAADSPTGSGFSDAFLAVVALLGEIPKTRPRASEPKPRSAITDIRI